MKFWKWYLKGVLNLPRMSISPWGEYVLSILFLIIGNPYIAIMISPFWLFLAIPVGVTIFVHSIWRISKL